MIENRSRLKSELKEFEGIDIGVLVDQMFNGVLPLLANISHVDADGTGYPTQLGDLIVQPLHDGLLTARRRLL